MVLWRQTPLHVVANGFHWKNIHVVVTQDRSKHHAGRRKIVILSTLFSSFQFFNSFYRKHTISLLERLLSCNLQCRIKSSWGSNQWKDSSLEYSTSSSKLVWLSLKLKTDLKPPRKFGGNHCELGASSCVETLSESLSLSPPCACASASSPRASRHLARERCTS